MRNLLISFGVATAVYILFGVVIGWGWHAIFLALPAMMLTNYLLARRTSKRLEGMWPEVTKALQQRRVDQAVKLLQDAKHESRHQLLIGRALDAQIGTILYAHKQDFEAARPYLESAHQKNWQAMAMLGAYHFKKKDYEAMEQVFERACKKNKKQGLLWATYAWCQWKRGEKDKAIDVLTRALKHQPEDDDLKATLLAVQNEKRLRMKRYEPEWWAFHLERAPQPSPEGRHGGAAALGRAAFGKGMRRGGGGRKGGRKKRR